MEALDIVHL